MSAAMPWFRLYHRTIDDPKLKLLAFEDRWHFVALCCLKANGLLDEPDSDIRNRKIAVSLGVQLRELDEISRRLREVDLIDEHLQPCAWDDLQCRSDHDPTAAKRQREKRRRDKGLEAVTDASRVTSRNVTRLEEEKEEEKEKEVVPNGTTKRARKRDADPVPKPSDVDDQVWSDFCRMREREGHPITLTALRGIKREADKAGWTLNDALIECVARAWRGFKAEWVKDQRNERPANQRFAGNSTLRELAERCVAGEQ